LLNLNRKKKESFIRNSRQSEYKFGIIKIAL
jgi:hypothetical protein